MDRAGYCQRMAACRARNEMETKMKMITAALTAAVLLAGAAAPASAETGVARIAEQAERVAAPEAVKSVKERRQVTRQMEYDTSKLPIGSSEWWQQYDRERGRRR